DGKSEIIYGEKDRCGDDEPLFSGHQFLELRRIGDPFPIMGRGSRFRLLRLVGHKNTSRNESGRGGFCKPPALQALTSIIFRKYTPLGIWGVKCTLTRANCKDKRLKHQY